MVTDFGNGEALRACKPGDAGEALVELLPVFGITCRTIVFVVGGRRRSLGGASSSVFKASFGQGMLLGEPRTRGTQDAARRPWLCYDRMATNNLTDEGRDLLVLEQEGLPVRMRLSGGCGDAPTAS